MKRLFVVNGLFGFLTCMASEAVRDTDTISVLVLFSYDDEANQELESRMRSIINIDRCTFLKDPSKYTKLFDDHEFMREVCDGPDEIRMFYTHNTWLHNRIFDAYPEADILLYEEGMASYYPGLIRRYDHRNRIRGVFLHNYLDRFVSPDSRVDPSVFGVIDRGRFKNLLKKVASRPGAVPEPAVPTVIVVEQYLFKKGRNQSLAEAAHDYVDAIREIVNKGYRVQYKRHPRESSVLFEHVVDQLSESERDLVYVMGDSAALVEETLTAWAPVAVASISSTSLLTAPAYFEVPSFRIPSLSPYDVASAVDVERRGLVTNQLALTARVPSVSELPDVRHAGRARELFTERFLSAPPLAEDGMLQSIGECDFDAGYVNLVRQIADPEVRAVSFDLFDTLVKRPAVQGSDIFVLLDRQLRDHLPPYVRFSDVRSTIWGRLDAEMDAQGGRPAEYSLTTVHDYIARVLGLSEEVREALLESEVALDEEVIRLRRAGFALTQVAETYGKPWVIVSDTYYDDEQLARVALSKLPVQPAAVLSSLNEQRTKAAGSLFQLLEGVLGVPNESVLHIGDRRDHDVDNARRAGLRAALFPSSTHAAMSKRRLRDTWSGVREERSSALMRGLIWSEVFDNPFRSFDGESVCGGDPWVLGYSAVGPALIGWSKWILRSAARLGYDDLLFLSRDGFLPLEICRRLSDSEPVASDHIAMSYTACSRRAMFELFSQRPGHIAYTDFVHGVNPNTTVRNLLTTRFGPAVATEFGATIASAGPNNMDERIGRHSNAVKAALARNAAAIAQRCHDSDSSAREYYREQVGEHDRPAVVDVGYSGSSQRGISLAVGKRVAGLYFTTMEHNTEHAHINEFEASEYASHPVFFSSGGLLEYLITPPGLESCHGFDARTGAPVLVATDSADPLREEVHRGIRTLIEDFFAVFGEHTEEFVMRPRLAVHTLATFMSSPTAADARTLEGGLHEDAVAGDDRDVFKYWREGRDALNSERSSNDRLHGLEEQVAARTAERDNARSELDALRSRGYSEEAAALGYRTLHGVKWRIRRAKRRVDRAKAGRAAGGDQPTVKGKADNGRKS